MHVYGAPLISPEHGATVIRSQARQRFICHRDSCNRHPERSALISRIGYLIEQAYAIYLYRVSAGPMMSQTSSPTAGMVEKFKAVLEDFPAESPGAHTLVWSTFIVAAESSTESQRQFFEQFLLRQQRRNGFRNIETGLAQLKMIWARKHENWTSILPESQVFVM